MCLEFEHIRAIEKNYVREARILLKENSNKGDFALSANVTHHKNIIIAILIVLHQEWWADRRETKVQSTPQTMDICILVYLFQKRKRILVQLVRKKQDGIKLYWAK